MNSIKLRNLTTDTLIVKFWAEGRPSDKQPTEFKIKSGHTQDIPLPDTDSNERRIAWCSQKPFEIDGDAEIKEQVIQSDQEFVNLFSTFVGNG